MLLRVGNASSPTGLIGAGLNDIYTLHEVEPATGVFLQNITVDPSLTGYGAVFSGRLLGAGTLTSSINNTFLGFAGVRAAAGSAPFGSLGPATIPATALVKWDGLVQRITSLGSASAFTCAAPGCYPSAACPAPPLLEDTGSAYVSLAATASATTATPLALSSGAPASPGTAVLAGAPACTYLQPRILANPTQLYALAVGAGCPGGAGLVSSAAPVPTSLSAYAPVLGPLGGTYGAALGAASSGVRAHSWALVGSPAFPTAGLALLVADSSGVYGGIWRFFVNPSYSGWQGNSTPWCTANTTSMAGIGSGVYYIVGGVRPFYADATQGACTQPAGFPFPLPNVAIANASRSQYVGVSYVPTTCAAGFWCASGSPQTCPVGHSCPQSSFWPTPCPGGSFSAAPGASACTQCAAGTCAPAAASTGCQTCPAGHACPAGSASWARLNCGRGNFCPEGAGAPRPCPVQAPPAGGWGELQVQGPAFLVDTAACLSHCFWNYTSGQGALSKC